MTLHAKFGPPPFATSLEGAVALYEQSAEHSISPQHFPIDSPEARIPWVRHILSYMEAAAHNAPVHAPSSLPYVRQFCLWLHQYCSLFGPLTLHVRPFCLLFESEVVFRDPQPNSFLIRLFEDGVTELTLAGEWSIQEGQKLFDILLQPTTPDDMSLSVMLWQAYLPSLSMGLIDPLMLVVHEEDWEQDQIFGWLQQQMQQDARCAFNFHGIQHKMSAERQKKEWVGSNEHIKMLADPLSFEERDAIQELLAGEDASLALRASELFLLILTQLKECREVEQLEGWLIPVAGALLQAKEFHAIAFLIEDFLSFGMASQPALAEAYGVMQEHLLYFLSQPERLRPVVALLEQEEPIATAHIDGLRAFFSALAHALGDQLLVRLEQVSPDSNQILETILGGAKA